jgi:tetratricopeptide (TPR) repeat protein
VFVFLLCGFVVRTAVGPPPSAGRRINRAILLAGEGDRQGAYELLQSVVEDYPGNADAWMRTGKALGLLDRPFDAAVYLRRAAELAPTSSIAQIECVNGLIRAELYDEAEAALDVARGRLPGEAGAAARLFRRAVKGHAWRPDRFRDDPLFDPVRNDPEFLQAIYDTRVPGSFREEPS